MVRCAAQHVAAALLRGHLRGLPRHRRLGHVVLRDQQREHAQERDTPSKTHMTQQNLTPVYIVIDFNF